MPICAEKLRPHEFANYEFDCRYDVPPYEGSPRSHLKVEPETVQPGYVNGLTQQDLAFTLMRVTRMASKLSLQCL